MLLHLTHPLHGSSSGGKQRSSRARACAASSALSPAVSLANTQPIFSH